MKDRYFEFEGREAKVDEHYNILLKVADVAADLKLSQEILLEDACDLGEWILGGEVLYIAVKKAKRATYINWVSEYALLERFIRSRMACQDSSLSDDGKPEQNLQGKPEAGVSMGKHEFEYKGSPVRVYVSEENKLYLNAGDVAHALGVSLKVLSVDFPEWEKINADEGGSVKVYSETAFIRGVRAMEEAGGVDGFFTWYAAELMPQMRFLLIQKAETRWSRDDKVRQLEQDLQRNLEARRKAGRNETQQNEPSGNQELIQALTNGLAQTAAHMGRLQRLAMEYRGILAELDHEFKGKRVIFGKLVEAIDRELAYGARWFPGTVGKPVEYAEAAPLGKAVGQ